MIASDRNPDTRKPDVPFQRPQKDDVIELAKASSAGFEPARFARPSARGAPVAAPGSGQSQDQGVAISRARWHETARPASCHSISG